MKSFRILLCFSMLASTLAFSQEGMIEEEGMMDVSQYEQGGYGAPVAKMTRINGVDGVLSGAKGAWIVDHTWSLGVAGYGLVNNVNFASNREPLEFAYGGVTLDYIYNINDEVALSAGVLLGGGFYDFNDNPAGNDGIYTAEPEVSLQYKVTKNFKTALLVGYRAVSDVDLVGVSNDKLSGITYGISFNIGVF